MSSAEPAKLLVGSSPASPEACPAGGTTLDFGTDLNGNGTLDPDEVTTSQVVCGDGAMLTTVTPSGPSDKCKNGGTIVQSGVDANGNGKLDANEVTETTEVCAGGTSVELSKTTTLAPGDETCPFGGTKTVSGVDNGADDGIAGNGVLEDGEIATTSIACTSDSVYRGTFVPPAGPAGKNKILTSGGQGTTGGGGQGGPVQIQLNSGTLGGNIAVFKTGQVDADFTMTPPKPSFGATKLAVTGALTIQHRTPDEAMNGQYYVASDTLYFRQNDANKQIPVTGIHVASGATLTLPGGTVNVGGDVHVEGTLTSSLLAGGNRATVNLYTTGRYISGEKSKVALAGAPVAGAAGGTGGTFYVRARAIFNAGAIDTSGANGDPGGTFNGGAGGPVIFDCVTDPGAGPIESTGLIRSVGGSGKAIGGSGGPILMSAAARGVRVKGALDQSGGSGGSGGGFAGNFSVTSNLGGARIGGIITRKGGDVDEAACGAAACSGGFVMSASVIAHGGDLSWSADMFASGGKSKGAPGGYGGNVTLALNDTSVDMPAGTIRVSGTFDLRGAAGTAGSNGGSLLINSSTARPSGQEILLYGYDSIDTSGGNGATSGGNAGQIQLINPPSSESRAGGSVISHANLTAVGGSATAGAGANGGLILAIAGSGSTETKRSQAVVSAGSIDNSGGNGTTTGGSSGALQLIGRESLVVSGAVTTNGGSASAASSTAGQAVVRALFSDGAVTITAPLSAAGGKGTGTSSKGGTCGMHSISGAIVRATAPIACFGGSGNGAEGGAGGSIVIQSVLGSSAVASLTAEGGAGTPPGAAGQITVDGAPF